VEQGEQCDGCKIAVPVVTSTGVTGWKLQRTAWRSITVKGCRLLCVLLRLRTVWQMRAERRCQVNQSRTKQAGATKPSEPAELGKSSSGLQIHWLKAYVSLFLVHIRE